MCRCFVVGKHWQTGIPHTLPDSYTMDTSGFFCYEGDCVHQQPARVFRDQQSLRQHQNKCHKGQATSMGRALKRRDDGKAAEESRKRQRLEEARIVAEAACHTPEPAPVL